MEMLWTVASSVLWCLWPLLIYIRLFYDYVVNVIIEMTVGMRKPSKLPPVFNPLLLLPATELAYRIRTRKVTSVEVVRAFVTRCSDVNPIINAVTQENFKEALQKAKRIDEYIRQGYLDGNLFEESLRESKPFLGVPFTVKETISVEGFPQTGGLVSRAKTVAFSDALVVQRTQDAGAILLATTNVSELGIWWECSNPLYGRTCNPYDTRRTCGGSSGGEAALMCSCGTPLSIGTDSGGSIRTPAFFCGLFGHKPTTGLVSVVGCNLHAYNEKNPIAQVAGPITRHSVDLLPILKILAGPETAKLELDKPVCIGRVQIYSVHDDCNRVMTSQVIKPLQTVQRRISEYFLQTYDISVSQLKINDLNRAFFLWREQMQIDYEGCPPIFSQLADNKGEINVLTEFTRNILNRQRYSLPSLVQATLEKVLREVQFLNSLIQILMGHPPSQNYEKKPGCKQLRMRLQRLLGTDGIILFPSHPTFPPFHRESYLKPFNFSYTAIFNALGFPVSQVPLGLDPTTGMPLGVQVVGGMYQDKLTIAIAAELEKAFGGWKCPAKQL